MFVYLKQQTFEQQVHAALLCHTILLETAVLAKLNQNIWNMITASIFGADCLSLAYLLQSLFQLIIF